MQINELSHACRLEQAAAEKLEKAILEYTTHSEATRAMLCVGSCCRGVLGKPKIMDSIDMLREEVDRAHASAQQEQIRAGD